MRNHTSKQKQVRMLAFFMAFLLFAGGCVQRTPDTPSDTAGTPESAAEEASSAPVEEVAPPEEVTEEAGVSVQEEARQRLQEAFAGDWIGMTSIWVFEGEDPVYGEEWKDVSTQTFARIAFSEETGDIGVGLDAALKDGVSFEDITAEADYERGWIVLRGTFLGVAFETYLWEPQAGNPLEFDLIIENKENITAAYCTVYLRRLGEPWAPYDTPMAGEETGGRIREEIAEMAGQSLEEITRHYENGIRRATGERIRITLPSSQRLTRGAGTAPAEHTGGADIWEGLNGYNTGASYETGQQVPEAVMDNAHREFSENFNMYGMTYAQIRDSYFDGIDATPTEFSDEATYYTYSASCIWYCEGVPEKTITVSFCGDDAADLRFENFIYSGFD